MKMKPIPEQETETHVARRELFRLGLRRGYLTVQEIEEALPEGSLSPTERWVLYYSLRAASIEVRGLRLLPGGVPPLD
jgi:hypothetical protein